MEGRALYAGAGNNPRTSPSCRLDLMTGQILTLPPSSSRPVATPAYKPRFARWEGGGVPVVRAHPFALLHFLATDQVPAMQLSQAARTVGSHAVHYSHPLTTPCSLLSMLGARRLVLAFDTSYDLDVRQYGQ
jgi:hypothetical protein